jgi:hypothetical protein
MKYVLANWKMYPTVDEALALLGDIQAGLLERSTVSERRGQASRRGRFSRSWTACARCESVDVHARRHDPGARDRWLETIGSDRPWQGKLAGCATAWRVHHGHGDPSFALSP